MKPISIDDGQGGQSLAFVGPLGEQVDRIFALSNGSALPCVTEEHVWSLHGKRVSGLLPLEPIMVPRGEAAKQWPVLQQVIAELAKRNHPRSLPILAMGGGAVGDLAGLAAALYRRGCPVIQVPTTLLAQVDSAVGGKTAIDAEGEKNLVGAFHPPALIFADPAFLPTLDLRERRAGLAEIVKYGAIADVRFFTWVERHGEAILAADPEACAEAAYQCLTMKADAVAGDVKDLTGRRALLNFGHSFGHAIESAKGLGDILHGEAVAVGMCLAARCSAAWDYCDPRVPPRLEALLSELGLPTRLSDVGLAGKGADLLPLIERDKKNDATGVTLILLDDLGKARLVRDIASARLAAFLSSL